MLKYRFDYCVAVEIIFLTPDSQKDDEKPTGDSPPSFAVLTN